VTWVKLSDTFAENFEELGADALALHVAALCYCNRLLTDGAVPAGKIHRLFPIGDPDAAVKALVTAGHWCERADGYEIVNYLRDQEAASVVEERAETKRQYDREFQRDRQKANQVGMRVDQWRAIQAKAAGLTINQWLAQQRDPSLVRDSDEDRTNLVTPDPSRPVPTRKGRERDMGPGSPEGSPDPVRGEKPKTPQRVSYENDDDESDSYDLNYEHHAECGSVHLKDGPCRCPQCGSVMLSSRRPLGGVEWTEVAGHRVCRSCGTEATGQ
jgi:hypothetical protein